MTSKPNKSGQMSGSKVVEIKQQQQQQQQQQQSTCSIRRCHITDSCERKASNLENCMSPQGAFEHAIRIMRSMYIDID